MRAISMVLVLLAAPALASSTEPPRFSGGGNLVAAGSESADGRYALKAELEPGNDAQRSGRFSLDARLGVSELVKAANTACNAGPDIFRSGFE